MTLKERTFASELNGVTPDQGTPDSVPAIGALLRRLRATRTLRQVESDTGIPNSYISAIEKGHKSPGLKTLTRLASYYEVPLQDLLQTAGLTQPTPSQADETSVLDVERSYAYVVADPNLNFVKPARHMPIDAQRYVVEMYQFYTGRKLL